MQSAIKKYGIVLVLAAIGLVVFHEAPASKKAYLLPTDAGSMPAAEPFSDASLGGHSLIHMAAGEKGLNAEIVLDTASRRDAWAGFGWLLDDANWTFMDTIYLEVQASGFDEIQLKLLTFDPDHSKRNDPSTYRQVIKEVPVTGYWQRIAVPAEYLYVPEWWYTQQGVDRKLDSKHLESVERFDIQPSSKATRGVPLTLAVKSVALVGASPRNAAILLGYLFLLMIFTLGANPHARRKSP